MGINTGGFVEISDNVGSTKAYQGTASTSNSSVPSVSGNVISQVLITNTGLNSLRISFDSGATFTGLLKKESLSWDVKGNIRQLVIKTDTGTTEYDILINFEDV